MKLLLGDCLNKLKELEDNSVDSIVTDPPYGISFMSKRWDYDVPSQEIWEESMRVLKPGGHLLSFAGSRTYHRMAVRIEDAGFEIRDQLMWIYGQGFPKSMNLGNTIDEYRGWGTGLKPAHEPIVMARKPLTGKSVTDNVIEWGTGGINIDESRIPTNDNLGGGATKGSVLDIEGFDRPWMHDEEKMKEFGEKMKQKVEHAQTLGRFPANIIFDEEAGKILDEQCEGVSRFFYCPKVSKNDRNEGNTHPTVKPTDLMLYLIRLVTPKGGITLDPFMGSGSTGKAAIRGGFDFIGIEREEEYFQIAEGRLNYEINNPYKEKNDKKAKVVEKVNKFFG